MENSKVAITGGAGFIGAALANELRRRGYFDVVLLDNLSTGDWSRLEYDFHTETIDISSSSVEQLGKKLTDVDILFHLSAVKLHNELNSFDDLVQNNIVGTQKILDAAAKAGVRHIVFSSSLYSYGLLDLDRFTEDATPNPTTVYGATKLFGEELVSISSKKYGFSFSNARLFFIYGEKQYSKGGYKSVIVNNFERLKSGLPAQINGDGNQILDYLHVSDCVDALIKLAENKTNDVFNISSGLPTTILQLTDEMLNIVGLNVKLFAPGDWTHNTRRVGSNTKIKNILGWQPRVSLEEGLWQTWKGIE
jgi:UDP-glucose 4-epimerase